MGSGVSGGVGSSPANARTKLRIPIVAAGALDIVGIVMQMLATKIMKDIRHTSRGRTLRGSDTGVAKDPDRKARQATRQPIGSIVSTGNPAGGKGGTMSFAQKFRPGGS